MSTALMTREAAPLATGGQRFEIATLDSLGLTEETKALLRKTVAVNSNDEELTMFLTLAHHYGLDPFNKEIWFIKYGAKPIIMTARDGYLKICQRDPEFLGINSAAVCEGDEFSFDMDPAAGEVRIHHRFGAKRGKVIGAWACATHRRRHRVITFARLDEYFKSSSPNANEKTAWERYTSAMICKVAESMALKRQGGISGLVTREEVETEVYDADAPSFRSPGNPVSAPAAVQASPPPAGTPQPEASEDRGEAVGLTLEDLKQAARDYGWTGTTFEERFPKWLAVEFPESDEGLEDSLDERDLREGIQAFRNKKINKDLGKQRGHYRKARIEAEQMGLDTSEDVLTGLEPAERLVELTLSLRDRIDQEQDYRNHQARDAQAGPVDAAADDFDGEEEEGDPLSDPFEGDDANQPTMSRQDMLIEIGGEQAKLWADAKTREEQARTFRRETVRIPEKLTDCTDVQLWHYLALLRDEVANAAAGAQG